MYSLFNNIINNLLINKSFGKLIKKSCYDNTQISNVNEHKKCKHLFYLVTVKHLKFVNYLHTNRPVSATLRIVCLNAQNIESKTNLN